MKQKIFKKNYLIFFIIILNIVPSCAWAINSGFQLQTILQNLIDLLNSSIARIIFVLAIIGVGYGWLYLGRIPKSRALGAIIGIGLVFSASYIARQLGVIT